MAGKVLTAFNNGVPGQVSTAYNHVIDRFHNEGNTGIAFGAPVKLGASGGAVVFSGSTAADFIGVACRYTATENTYGGNDADYRPKEMMDILTEGRIVVHCAAGTPALNGAVYITSTGEFSATATSNTQLTNCVWRGAADANGNVEMNIKTRVI